ncbi:hypothetical protein AEAC466_13410 [Asticcacaulis sp. AC466]|nr:hypothetical protein AEAC466_13410 [Asticcacaulis sp. AC466]
MSSDEIETIALRHKLESDFYFFVRYAYKQTTGRRWLRNWHHEVLCARLEAVWRGEVRRLIINMPPRYSKTEIVCVLFIAWCLAKAPDCEFINVSYAARLAANNGARARDIVAAAWFRTLWPRCGLKAGAAARDDWRTTSGGVIYSTGSDGTITGFGAGKPRDGFGGAILIDDPHKADEAASDTIRQSVIDWFGNTLESRCNTAQTPIVVIMQRLHPEDLSGFLLGGGNGEDWEHICLPAIGADGRALWPEKHSLERLSRMKAANLRVFTAQYQQAPSQALLRGALWTQGLIDEAWRRGRLAAETQEWGRVVVGVDPSGGGDDVGIVAVAEYGDGAIVLEDATVSAGEGDTALARTLHWATRVAQTCRRWNADCIVGERNFGGDMVEATLRAAQIEDRVVMVTASRGKHVRAEPVAAFYDQGRMAHLDRFTEMEAEMKQTTPLGYQGAGSPNRLDALVWAIHELKLRSGFGYGMLEVV